MSADLETWRDFPRADAFLRGLSLGIDSYPDHVQKASIYREYLKLVERDDLETALPAELVPLVRDPLLPSTWISEARVTALYLAVSDLVHPSEQAFVDHWLQVNRNVLSGPLYRVMFTVASPMMVAKGAQRKWGTIHRGIELALVEKDRCAFDVTLTYPSGLLPRLMAVGYTTAWQAAVEAAGGTATRVRLLEHTPRSALFSVAWE